MANAEEIREAVAASYGKRVRPVLERGDTIPLMTIAGVDAGACCEPAADGSDACCAPVALNADADCCTPATNAEDGCCVSEGSPDQISRIAQLYSAGEVADLPATVTDVAFGCGNPTAISALLPGQVVLDLGSGGGIDCFLAAKMVGESGQVIGVDMTHEMIRLARKNKETVGATNVEFRLGEIEHLPVADESVDVIISNCVINLSPDKDQVFREAYRVLRPGGRLQVSDIVWTKPVPEGIRSDMEQWAGCIAGALEEREYLAGITAAGFRDVVSQATEYPDREGLASAAVTATK